ncbi:MAG TPA: tRNA lysidine(34) synthetase TilS [Polyangiaceae bacterium]
MPRSHPPTLITLASRALVEECGVARGDRILVAVSGGPDSMALLDVLGHLREKLGFDLLAHGVDHGLRPEASDELELVRRLAERIGVPFASSRVALAPGGNLQARARSARYAALEAARVSGSAAFLATAHHADDRAETLLLRLLRGSGPRGLAVLPPRAGVRIRPLLRARRTDVMLHLERHRVPFATDPSNRDRRYLRARVREELLPLATELSPGIVEHLNSLADALLGEDVPGELENGSIRVELGRAQRQLLRRARALGQRRAAVRLPGGWEARIHPTTGEATLVRAAERRQR